jgi:predicted peroxiredoxin
MGKMSYVGSHGTDDPTRAGLAFVMANGAREAGHEATVAVVGDAVLLMKEVIAQATHPVGRPPVQELMATAASRGTAIHV